MSDDLNEQAKNIIELALQKFDDLPDSMQRSLREYWTSDSTDYESEANDVFAIIGSHRRSHIGAGPWDTYPAEILPNVASVDLTDLDVDYGCPEVIEAHAKVMEFVTASEVHPVNYRIPVIGDTIGHEHIGVKGNAYFALGIEHIVNGAPDDYLKIQGASHGRNFGSLEEFAIYMSWDVSDIGWEEELSWEDANALAAIEQERDLPLVVTSFVTLAEAIIVQYVGQWKSHCDYIGSDEYYNDQYQNLGIRDIHFDDDDLAEALELCCDIVDKAFVKVRAIEKLFAEKK
jgi:hypothetical protein